MRLLICAGGTGGGVYPAVAVLNALQNEVENPTLWVGSVGGMEVDLVIRSGTPFEAIPAAGVHGVGMRALPGNLLQLGRGYSQAKRILKAFQPDVLFFTGGYVAVPVALAGRTIPSVLYVPDIEPGLALKTLARFADRIAVTANDSRSFFPKRANIEVVGYPVRSGLRLWSQEPARQALGLTDDLPVLLVFGGSKGARSINRALLPVLPELLEEMQVVHISGQLDWSEVKAARDQLVNTYVERGKRYRAFPYLHAEMGAAFTVADLVLARAGASTLGEFPLFGLPAILVPYPHAWRYQMVNAHFLADRGAAVILHDGDLPSQLLPTVRSIMRNQDRREHMQDAMRSLAQPAAAESIAQLLRRLVEEQSMERN